MTISVSALPLQTLGSSASEAVLSALPDVLWTLPASMASDGLPTHVRVRALGCGLTVPADCADRGRVSRQLDRLRRTVDIAADNHVPVVATTTGPAGKLRWEDALQQRGDELADIACQARRAGIVLTLENTHSLRSDVSFLHSLRDTVAAARAIGTAVCADLYCCWAEPALAETLVDGAEVIDTVQYGDFVHGTLVQPNRWVPGDGDLPVDRLVAAVLASGFRGTHEIEVLSPRIDEEGVGAALRRSVVWLHARLTESSTGERDLRTRAQRVTDTVTALRGS